MKGNYHMCTITAPTNQERRDVASSKDAQEPLTCDKPSPPILSSTNGLPSTNTGRVLGGEFPENKATAP